MELPEGLIGVSITENLGDNAIKSLTYVVRAYLEPRFPNLEIKVSRFQEYTLFTPATFNPSIGSLVAIPSVYYSELDLTPFIGRFPLNTDPLIEYMLRSSSDIQDLQCDYGVYHLPMPIGMEDVSVTETMKKYQVQLDTLRSTGHFTIKYRDISLVRNLASLAEYAVVAELENYIVLRSRSAVYDFDFEHAIDRILGDQIPVAYLSGNWQIELALTPLNKAIMTFLAYRILARDDVLKSLYYEILVYPDGRIRVPFRSHSQMTKFHNDLVKDLHRYRNLAKTYRADSLLEATLIRWYLYRINADTLSMTMSIDNVLIVVTVPPGFNRNLGTNPDMRRSESLPMAFADKHGPISENEYAETSLGVDLASTLIDFYTNVCSSPTDPVSLQEFSEMGLSELIRVVQPEADNRYCYTAKSLSAMNVLISPITRKPFPEFIYYLLQDDTLAARGVVPLAQMRGLLESPKDLALPTTEPIAVLKKAESLDINRSITEISADNGTQTTDVMDIATMITEPEWTLISTLWSSGYFLNPWGRVESMAGIPMSRSAIRRTVFGSLGTGVPEQVSAAIQLLRNIA